MLVTRLLYPCNTSVTTYILIRPCYTVMMFLLQSYYTMLHPCTCSFFSTSLLNHVTALQSYITFVTSFVDPYYTMLHPCNTFVSSLLNHVPHFCCTLIIPCYTPVTLLLYPYYTIYIVAFCPVAFSADTLYTMYIQ